MKTIKLSFVALAILVLGTFIFTGCSDEGSTVNYVLKSAFKEGESRPVIDTLFVVNESKSAMISFVNEIKTYHLSGMTYDELKKALDPDTGLANITPAGNELLLEAYNYWKLIKILEIM